MKILHYIPGFRKGGIESLFLDIYQNISNEDIQFDLVVEKGMSSISDEDIAIIKNLGGNIIEISPFTPKKLISHIKDIVRIIKYNDYNVAHSHSIGKRFIFLLISWIYKIPKRIIHGHMSRFENNIFINRVGLKISILCSTHCIACSQTVLDSMFSKVKRKTRIIYNGINLNKFKKSDINKELDKNQIINFVHVGRFTFAKNHIFLIKIFSEIIKVKKNCKLTLVGEGPLKSEILENIKLYNLQEKVEILSATSNIPQVLAKSHYAIFPSIYEGFGISVLEFQVMNLPCFISDSVQREVDLGLCEFLSLNRNESFWAEYIINYIDNDTNERNVNSKRIDIRNISLEIEKIYYSSE